ncbi:MAG: sigma-54-dependent transcriptional regulator [Gemmatimonas sp.]|uniref:sigma-54-dependent transcriptional regulator n=1 Tax=Gemmatimonas sp. TaxID=1962908 RepID=UPI0022C572D0|nr:sigma-54 dependent transcriptional regulator [Gemmatimonas sp.]MCE2955490.1 sigma-54 dependent transcriptional regulator [Gemmatimonas sp.]MCZ8013689.1 sigma-54 dependent transcriptional regulator [Gemmatimonas sp.]MCZ8267572.1 sigma-54 dependent transcriptional regulator [Gemmatimonas sp.]
MILSILVIDDDETVRSTLVEFFETFGYTARGAATASAGRQLAAEHAPDVVLLDLRLPDAHGIVALDALLADDPELAVIMLTGHADVATAVKAMQHGAADLLEKPMDLEALAGAVERAARRGRLKQEVAVLRAQSRADEPAKVSLAPTLEQLIVLAAQNADAPVLLQGETGTGKGFVARQIHERSARNQSPFVEINCASLSTTFFESELFGHERGAFTDARQAKRGLLEVAGDGTVFLDEIAEMGQEVQPRLLKVLEERTFRRLGGTTTLRSNARIIAATHQPLAEAVAERRFRADLYYRLQVLTLTLPPLRANPEEVFVLSQSFLPKGHSLTRAAQDALRAYRWPGNIRELKNTLWRAAILAGSAPIDAVHLGLPGASAPAAPTPASARVRPLEETERDAIRTALDVTNGNRSAAAKALGIARSTLLEKLKRYGLE